MDQLLPPLEIVRDPCGATFIVLSRRDVPLVFFRFYFLGGEALEPLDSPGLIELTSDLLNEGPAGMSPKEWHRRLDKDALSLSTSFMERYWSCGLLKVIQVSELALKITKLTFKWNDFLAPVKEAQRLMEDVQKLSIEISEYEHRMGSKLSDYQRNIIYNSMEDLEKLIPYLKNKIKHYESLENKVD